MRLRERVARSMFRQVIINGQRDYPDNPYISTSWDNENQKLRDDWLNLADIAIAEILK